MGIRKGRAVKIPVTLGLLRNTTTEIETGLLEGDVAGLTIWLSPNAATEPTSWATAD